MNVSPEMLSVAWRAFKGNRSHLSVRPGPGFKEAIEAIAPLILEEAAKVAETGVGWIGNYHKTPGLCASEAIATAIRAMKDPA